MIGFNTKTASQETSQETSQENKGSSGGVGVLQNRILELIRNNPRITAKNIAKEIGIAPRNAQTHISKLKKLGSIERAGSTKSGQWTTNSSDKTNK